MAYSSCSGNRVDLVRRKGLAMDFKASGVCRALAGALLLILAGCSHESLYSNLSEQEANEMVAVLSEAGLDASKQALKGNTFSVSTAQSEFAQAVQLLESNGLPRERYDTMGEVFAKEGFVSSPLEERARLNYALSQEMSATLSSIDGVVLARVHLAVPPRNELNDSVAPTSASVFIKYQNGFDLADSVSRIKSLVVNGIENLPYENVTVALFEAQGASQLSDTVAPPVPVHSANAVQMSLLPAVFNNSSAGVTALLALLLVAVLALVRIWHSKRS